MRDMREEFMKRIDARDSKNEDKVQYDMAAYPFAEEEMLLNAELRDLEETKEIKFNKEH